MFIVRADPNYAQPWQMRPQRSGTGSAFITDVAKRRIMTNAHVVRPRSEFYTGIILQQLSAQGLVHLAFIEPP